MAARLNRRHQDSVREKIRATQLVNALEGHVLSRRKMTATQVTAALGLLKKCVPDLSRAEVTGEGGKPLAARVTVEFIGQAAGSVPVPVGEHR